MNFFAILVLISCGHPLSVRHLPRRISDLCEHETAGENQRRDNGHQNPEKTALEDGEYKTDGGQENE